jgi:CRP/FNR family transcriptional regulator
MSFDDQMIIIRRNDFLEKLTRDDFEQLHIMPNFIVADKDAFIYFDASYHNKLYFIKEGFIKIGNVDDDGNELVKEILQAGDVFGNFTLERNNMMGEFAQAHKCQTVLCAFTLPDFEQLLELRPDLGIAFTKKVGQKLKRVEFRLLNLLQKDVKTRLLYFFWSLVQQQPTTGANTLKLINYLTHDDISRLICTSRQTVTTLINQFSVSKILDVDRRYIIIHDIKLLKKEAKVG